MMSPERGGMKHRAAKQLKNDSRDNLRYAISYDDPQGRQGNTAEPLCTNARPYLWLRTCLPQQTINNGSRGPMCQCIPTH